MHGGWWWMALAGIVSAGVKLGCWCYGNTHWWVKEMRRIEALGVQERQAVLANGHVINYAELGGEGPALLLIHGQMGAWQDYAAVMLQLSQQWHVYAVDVYGHGGSSHEEALYYLDVNGEDLIAFIEQEIGAPVVVSGHSNGALLAAYMAAYGGRWVRGALLEDPPVFSTEVKTGKRPLPISTPMRRCTRTCRRRRRSAGPRIICGTVTGVSCS